MAIYLKELKHLSADIRLESARTMVVTFSASDRRGGNEGVLLF
jgi:hypothetical protein